MVGTFNGLHLEKITSLKTTKETPGFILTTFRVLGGPLPDLEQLLLLNSSVLLTLPSEEIVGRLASYSANIHSGYEITLESRG
jgi:hypothetical protein